MTTLSAYLDLAAKALSHAKSVTTAFHLYYEEAKRELFAALLGCHSSKNSLKS